MAGTYTKTLFKEDWSKFPAGPIRRDNSARGEYMAMVVPENPPRSPAPRARGTLQAPLPLSFESGNWLSITTPISLAYAARSLP